MKKSTQKNGTQKSGKASPAGKNGRSKRRKGGGRGKFAIAWLAILAVVGWFGWYALTPLDLGPMPKQIEIKRTGSGLKGVAAQLVAQQVLPDTWRFVLLGRLLGGASRLKSGNYEFDQAVSPYRLYRKLTDRDASQLKLTFIEGWSFRQMRERLNQEDHLKHETEGMSDAQVMAAIGGVGAPEGQFFPDTYFISGGGSDLDVLKRAHAAMAHRLMRAWEDRAEGLPYRTPYEALIMASLIEKETGQAVERPLIASVFLNRLRLGMRLQTDPTVIYGMGAAYTGKIHKQDLQKDTPYNTYTRGGLPPTPIAMPGMEAIQAALHPDKSEALYFVAKGNGYHYFSKTLEEHNRAVARYQLGLGAARD